MATASEIVESSLRDAGIIDPLEQVGTEDLTEGLRLMNKIMRSWTSDGMDLYTHTDMEAGSTFPLSTGLQSGFEAMLAVSLASKYGQDIDRETKIEALEGYNKIFNAYVTEVTADFDGGLKDLPSQGTDYIVSST